MHTYNAVGAPCFSARHPLCSFRVLFNSSIRTLHSLTSAGALPAERQGLLHVGFGGGQLVGGAEVVPASPHVPDVLDGDAFCYLFQHAAFSQHRNCSLFAAMHRGRNSQRKRLMSRRHHRHSITAAIS